MAQRARPLKYPDHSRAFTIMSVRDQILQLKRRMGEPIMTRIKSLAMRLDM